jgi:hypothetical protein
MGMSNSDKSPVAKSKLRNVLISGRRASISGQGRHGAGEIYLGAPLELRLPVTGTFFAATATSLYHYYRSARKGRGYFTLQTGDFDCFI